MCNAIFWQDRELDFYGKGHVKLKADTEDLSRHLCTVRVQARLGKLTKVMCIDAELPDSKKWTLDFGF